MFANSIANYSLVFLKVIHWQYQSLNVHYSYNFMIMKYPFSD